MLLFILNNGENDTTLAVNELYSVKVKCTVHKNKKSFNVVLASTMSGTESVCAQERPGVTNARMPNLLNAGCAEQA